MHACTGTNTANLSEPIACMNRSIASTLPRTWQDINNSLDPTAASNWQLSSIKRYTSESRPPLHPPLQSQPSSFHWMKLTTKLHCSMYFNLWNISKGESFSSCTRHEETGDISLRLCMPQIKSCHVVKHGCRVLDKSFNFQWFVLPPKFFANLAVTFFGFAAVLSTCCCARHVKEDDRVFQLFVLQHDKW